MTPLEHEALEGLTGLMAWNVQQGYGSFVTMEFGDPWLDVAPPKRWSHPEHQLLGDRTLTFVRRTAHVRGQWHLWIHCCAWEIRQDEHLLATSEHDRERINRAAIQLDGQKPQQVLWDPDTGNTHWLFDLGGRLQTSRYEDDPDWPYDETEQWLLYRPDRDVAVMRANGRLTVTPDSEGYS